VRRRRLPWRLALGLIAAATLLPAGAVPWRASASSPTLAGYSGSAAASGVHAFYNPEGLLPVAAPVDAGVPDALATVDTGPATFARASVADPGDLLANPDALIGLGVSQWKPGTLPPYPFRVDAASGSKTPSAESSPGPGLDARVDAADNGSHATSTTPAVSAPPIANVGSMSAAATTTMGSDNSSVTTHALTKVSHFDLLGLLTIDSVVTDLTSTSTGGPVKLSGGTVVSGASFMGQPVTIDATGVHAAKGSPLASAGALNSLVAAVTGSLTSTLNDALVKAGIRITVLGPVKTAGDDTGQLGSEGLRIDLDVNQQTFPAMKTLFDQLAPLAHNPVPGAPGPEDVINVLEANHLFAIEVGRGVVSLQATSATPEPDVAAESAATGGDAVPSASSPAVDLGQVATPQSDFASTGATPASLGGSPAVAGATRPASASLSAGIGIVALLVLLLQPLLGDRLARMADTVLAPDGGDVCPVKED
jgi:hypothetical protein